MGLATTICFLCGLEEEMRNMGKGAAASLKSKMAAVKLFYFVIIKFQNYILEAEFN